MVIIGEIILSEVIRDQKGKWFFLYKNFRFKYFFNVLNLERIYKL